MVNWETHLDWILHASWMTLFCVNWGFLDQNKQQSGPDLMAIAKPSI